MTLNGVNKARTHPSLPTTSILIVTLKGAPRTAFTSLVAVLGGKSPLHSSYERGCQEKRVLPAPRRDAGVLTYIQPSHSRKGDWLAALARRRLQRRWNRQ